MEEFEQAMNASRAKDENNVPQLLSLQWIDLSLLERGGPFTSCL